MEKTTSLTDLFFHSFNSDGDIQWQGQVLCPIGDYHLIQLYSWIMGEQHDIILVHPSDMLNWKFYRDEGYWRYAAEIEQIKAAHRATLAAQENGTDG